MVDIPVEQAIYGNADAGGFRFLARSPGFLDDWLAAAEELCTGFGNRPADVACPHAVFAQPLGPDHVAVVQVADQGTDDAGRPGALGFHLLVLPRKPYAIIGEPFLIAQRFPPPWVARGELLALAWPDAPLPPRTVAEVQRILKGADTAALLGGAQVLVDGGRLVLERPAPATPLVHDLWALLPQSTRRALWPASFAFGNRLSFDVIVLPRVEPGECEGYVTEEQAGDYPPGRYELSVQVAAETNDQGQLDALFSRRSSAETLRLAVILVVIFGVVAVVANILNRERHHAPATLPQTAREKPPLAEKYPALSRDHRKKLGVILEALLKELKVPPPAHHPDDYEMLAALDKHLGTPNPRRDPGPLEKAAPRDLEKQLRLLLWKHDIKGYEDDHLNPVELAERLRDRLIPKK